MSDAQVTVLDTRVVVRQRLEELHEWYEDWKRIDNALARRAKVLGTTPIDIQRGAQIGSLRKRLLLQQVKRPFEIDPEIVRAVGYPALRQHLVEQFARLTKDERLFWLRNFMFIMTPDLRQLNDKVARVREYRSFGQQRNFLLGGESGMGKTTYLDWFTSNFLPAIETTRNHVPIIKIDAPEGHSPRPLFQRIILACGMNYLQRDKEENLLQKLSTFFQQCGVEVVIIDEVEHIKSYGVRRRVLEISNMTYGVPIICASCQPHLWVEGDPEIAGRWNDYVRLEQYAGKRLIQLLVFINLLLPFTEESFPHLHEEIASPKGQGGIAGLIRKLTKGTVRDIMLLIREASKDAIMNDLPCLNAQVLDRTWKSIQTRPTKRIVSVTTQEEQ